MIQVGINGNKFDNMNPKTMKMILKTMKMVDIKAKKQTEDPESGQKIQNDTQNDTKNRTLTDDLQEVNNDAIYIYDTKNDTKN